MELLRDIAHISGKSGLYRILKPGRGGVIVETLDEKKQKEMVSSNARVSVLKDISIYTEDPNKSIPLGDIFLKARELHGEKVEFDFKTASNNQSFDFFAGIMPELFVIAPVDVEEEETVVAEATAPVEEIVAEEKPAKAKKKAKA